MKKLIISTIICLFTPSLCAQEIDTINVLFWNLENFFDYRNDGANDSDKEFSSFGSRRWTKTRFLSKCNAIAKSLMWIKSIEGDMPDIFAMAEVENRGVLYRLIYDTLLKNYDYGIVHYDSPDSRGIDVALIYRTSSLQLLSSCNKKVYAPEGRELSTRDILLAEFRKKETDDAQKADSCRPEDSERKEFAILVNHHPSKYGGGDTGWRRQAALSRMTAIKDSLTAQGVTAVIATGDFNEQANKIELDEQCAEMPFVNLGREFADRGYGTIRYNGIWEMIDMFMLTETLVPNSEMKIVEIPFLTVWDNVHSGFKPLRTYSGPKYIGGVSDHNPILLKMRF